MRKILRQITTTFRGKLIKPALCSVSQCILVMMQTEGVEFSTNQPIASLDISQSEGRNTSLPVSPRDAYYRVRNKRLLKKY